MIRQVSSSELGGLLNLAEEFHASSRFINAFEGDKFIAIWGHLMTCGGVIFADYRDGFPVGMLGGFLHRDAYSEKFIAEEMFWFVARGARGAGVGLYRTFEAWAKENGASDIHMVHLLDSMPAKLARFYIGQGYEAMETRYLKRLAA